MLPALHEGTWVVLDRFWWSTWVYGAAYGVPEYSLETMIELERLHWGQLKPHVLFLVERESGVPDVDGLQGRYRQLFLREGLNSSVIKLNNDSCIRDALDATWDAVTCGVRRLTEGQDISTQSQPISQLSLLEEGALQPPSVSSLSPAKPTAVYDTYWQFAAERQEMFFRRLDGSRPPWTDDSILSRFKFTNAYRASDRVSQYLIRDIHLRGPAIPGRGLLPYPSI